MTTDRDKLGFLSPTLVQLLTGFERRCLIGENIIRIALGKPYHYSYHSNLDAIWDVLLGGYSDRRNQICQNLSASNRTQYKQRQD
jgi:hypothetical protein